MRSDANLPDKPVHGDLARTDRSATQIKVGARLGVWGLVGGIGIVTAGTLGAPLTFGAAMALMGAGLICSGVGTAIASIGVLRRTGRAPRPIRTAAIAGVPLGGVLALLGLTSLTQWPPLVAVVNGLTPAAGLLGAVVVVLLMVGFVLPGFGPQEKGASSESASPGFRDD